MDQRLLCASCSPSGERPEEVGNYPVGSFVQVSWSDNYSPSSISEDGDRVFFDSEEPLVPRDTNGVLDAYEWEMEGTGTCGIGQGSRGGCIYLLSQGSATNSSYVIGESKNGSDVFIATKALLTPEAGDELFKLYDARVDGVRPVSPPACTGTGCQGVPAAAPIFATPASVTYAGVGNFSAPTPVVGKIKAKSLTSAQKLAKALESCKGKPRKRRVFCQARARKLYGVGSKAKRRSRSKTGRK